MSVKLASCESRVIPHFMKLRECCFTGNTSLCLLRKCSAEHGIKLSFSSFSAHHCITSDRPDVKNMTAFLSSWHYFP